MKIKRDFVTNSSSTCFIFDKRELTEEEVDFLNELCLSAPLAEYYRSSQCLEGSNLRKYITKLINEQDGDLAMTLLGYVVGIGIENIIMVVEGDSYGLEESPPDGLLGKSKTEYSF